jgi:hypothetical protein
MICSKCANKNNDEAKFCSKCSSELVNDQKLNTENKYDKLNKSLLNSGNLAIAVGWLSLIINVALYLFVANDASSAVDSGLPLPDLSGTIISATISIICIILGGRLKIKFNKDNRKYLTILIWLLIAFGAWTISSGGKVGILFIIAIIYLISSSLKIQKALKEDEYKAKEISVNYKFKKLHWIIFGIVSAIAITSAILYDTSRHSLELQPTEQLSTGNESLTQTDITEIVKEMKKSFTLPQKIDEVTDLVNVSAENNAIRYHYILSNVDPSQLSNKILFDAIKPSICSNSDTLKLLGTGINMEYSYSVQGNNQKYFITFTKQDCS